MRLLLMEDLGRGAFYPDGEEEAPFQGKAGGSGLWYIPPEAPGSLRGVEITQRSLFNLVAPWGLFTERERYFPSAMWALTRLPWKARPPFKRQDGGAAGRGGAGIPAPVGGADCWLWGGLSVHNTPSRLTAF